MTTTKKAAHDNSYIKNSSIFLSFACTQMSRTSLKLKQGDVMRGNNKERLGNYIDLINQELGTDLPNFDHPSNKISVVAGPLTNFLNEHEYGLREGNDVNEERIRRFINRIKQEQDSTPPPIINSDSIAAPSYSAPMPELLLEDSIAAPSHSLPRDFEETTLLNNDTEDDYYENENNDNNNNDNNNNDVFSETQMAQLPQQQMRINELVRAALQKYNTVSRIPISPHDLPQNPQQQLMFMLQKLATLDINHISRGPLSRDGMVDLKNIILDLKRDIRRVTKAMSAAGAQEMVEKHNAQFPNEPSKHWAFSNEDINGDNIPDLCINNSKGEHLFINGYTTRKSDWPIKYMWYNDYQTPAARKEARETYPTMSAYARNKFNIGFTGDVEEDLEGELDNLGKATTYTTPAELQNVNPDILKKYSGFPRKKRDKSAFERFKQYIANGVINDIIRELNDDHHYHVPGKVKTRLISKVQAQLWKDWIIANVAQTEPHVFDLNDPIGLEAFNKWKKTSSGKDAVNSTVTDLLYHLNRTNDDIGWTADQRNALVQALYNDARADIVHFLEELTTGDERAGHLFIAQPPDEHGGIQIVEQDYDGRIQGQFPSNRITTDSHVTPYGEGPHRVQMSRGDYTHAIPVWARQDQQE